MEGTKLFALGKEQIWANIYKRKVCTKFCENGTKIPIYRGVLHSGKNFDEFQWSGYIKYAVCIKYIKTKVYFSLNNVLEFVY